MAGVVLALSILASVSIQPQDFDTEIVLQVLRMVKAPVPTKIEVERVSQETLQNEFRGDQMILCMRRNGNFPYCANYVSQFRTFIYGHWIEEKDPLHLHIRIYERAPPDTIVHEVLHWWIYNVSEPRGLLNLDDVVERLKLQIITSPEFIDFLKGR